jgi:outer membrane cobalamin receptor
MPFPVANPSLRPERALNWDAGAQLRLGKLRTHVAVYRTWVDDLIKYFGYWPTVEVVNIDHIDIWGIDADIELVNIGPFAVFTGICRQDVGRFTKQNPDTKINARIDYAAGLRHSKLECSLTGEWISGLYMSNYSRDPIKDVFFADASVRLRTQIKSGVFMEPYIIVRNTLDVPYSIFGKILDVGGEYIENYTLPGINVLAGLLIRI